MKRTKETKDGRKPRGGGRILAWDVNDALLGMTLARMGLRFGDVRIERTVRGVIAREVRA